MIKYAELEIERRWLVDVHALPPLETMVYTHIEDRYILGTRTRLRVMREQNNMVYKLCKKYGKRQSLEEEVVNIYLDEDEYRVFSLLPADVLVRRRYRFTHDDYCMAITVAEGGDGLESVKGSEGQPGVPTIAECEFANQQDALAFMPPMFCIQEVSDDPLYEARCFARRQSPD